MIIQELSDSFDTLLNSYDTVSPTGEQASKREIVLDEYEKSVFLTKGQEETILSLYKGTSIQDGFETTEELRRYLEPLVKTITLTTPIQGVNTLAPNSVVFNLSSISDLWFITYEQVQYDSEDPCLENYRASVVPVTQDAFSRTINNPFKGPTKARVLRLDKGKDAPNPQNLIELVPKEGYEISKYLIRYLSKPKPIILEDLGDLTVNGQSTKTVDSDLILNDNLYKVILDRAVQLAAISKGLVKQS